MEGRGGDPTGYQEWQGTAVTDGELSMAGAHPWALHKGAGPGPWPRVWAGLAPSSVHICFFFPGVGEPNSDFYSWEYGRAFPTPVFGLTAKNEVPLPWAAEMDPAFKGPLLNFEKSPTVPF